MLRIERYGAFFVMAYIQGQSRSQTSLFPVSLEELIPEDHLVRVIDLYVAKLDLVRLGFDKALPKSTGRPSYHPADQLKLYLFWRVFCARVSGKKVLHASPGSCRSQPAGDGLKCAAFIRFTRVIVNDHRWQASSHKRPCPR